MDGEYPPQFDSELPHEVLGIAQDADLATIKAAFKKLKDVRQSCRGDPLGEAADIRHLGRFPLRIRPGADWVGSEGWRGVSLSRLCESVALSGTRTRIPTHHRGCG
eukprot:m.263534 g.263534  ORF g.263534 m.263534 type:complete len:106 (-) comp16010_c0_seq13:360-677(-)